MKNLFNYFVLFLFAGLTARAQAPQAFNYQGIARSTTGVPLASTSLGLRLTIHDGSPTGTVVYTETQTPVTNSFGLYNVSIGGGTVVTGTFSGINWGTGGKYLEVGIDPAGGTNYAIAGTNQLLSVPYSVYANNAGNADALQGHNVSTTAPTSGDELTWDAGTSSWTPTAPSGGTVTTINTTAPLTGGPITSSGIIGLANSGVTAATYGSGTQIPNITVDAFGRITNASTSTITIPTMTGTTNYIPVYTAANAIGNSNIYQNGSRLVINNGTVTHGLMALKASTDSIGLYLNESGAPTIYGSERLEYTGTTDVARVGLLSTSIRLIGDLHGTGIEGAGNEIGVQGLAEASTAGDVEGLEGDSYGSGTYSIGMAGFGAQYTTAPTNCYGVYGTATGGVTNYAGYFQGNVKIIGSISKTSGTFEIDHPLDPANKYLYHSFVESPDMMNIYNGNIVTDANGDATVTLPSYFDALNKDFRYQLTTIGSFAQTMVAEEISGNSFKIKTNQPNVKVSWMVTGVRQDAWANAHRVVAEVDKEPFNKGKYLTPKEEGFAEELGIGSDIKPHGKKNDPAVISQK